MLILAAILTICVALMHSIAGQKFIIAPIVKNTRFPIYYNDPNFVPRTLFFGWHILSLMWFGLAGLLVYLQISVAGFSDAFLSMISLTFGVCGIGAIIFSKGKHRSWVFFLPVSAICAFAALT